jgi:antitoxin component YwqK of YwqJK toxin-antitoxin module
MNLRQTRRGCGLAFGLLMSWQAAPSVVWAEDASAPAEAPSPPALIELEATAELGDADAPATERVQDRHPNRTLKSDRRVAQDKHGNFFNHGPFTAWDEEGRMIGRGDFRFGKREGKWTRWYSTAETETTFAVQIELGFTAPFTSQAEFVEGKLQGAWSIVDAKQRPVSAWEFENGARNGMSMWWYPDGKKFREAEYRSGDLDGMAREWARDDSLLKEEKFIAGHRVGIEVEYYEGGELKSECEMVFSKLAVTAADDWWNGTTDIQTSGREGKNQRHGKYQAWDRAGNLILSGSYVDDKPDGKFTWWFSNGNKAIEGSYVAGKQDGRWTWWHENGLKEIAGEYALGYESGRWQMWDENGRVAETMQIIDGPAKSVANGTQPPPVPTLSDEQPAEVAEQPAPPQPVRRVNFEQQSFQTTPEEAAPVKIEQAEGESTVKYAPVLKIVERPKSE